MRAEDRAPARKSLDKRLDLLRNSDYFARPPRGWIKAIREALGMTTTQLGKRLGVSQPRIVKIEKSERNGALTLETIERVADALDCQVVYALVPRKPLEAMVEHRAMLLARQRLGVAAHSMALEDQSVGDQDHQDQLQRLAKSLAQKSGSILWCEE
ncbi:MAG: putative DNA-binding mobile mystery protein A [Gammaproteobacteria bacterium]|jgi:predicted DNA-binding mobile mystery protein A